jgi:hypothetical protein
MRCVALCAINTSHVRQCCHSSKQQLCGFAAAAALLLASAAALAAGDTHCANHDAMPKRVYRLVSAILRVCVCTHTYECASCAERFMHVSNNCARTQQLKYKSANPVMAIKQMYAMGCGKRTCIPSLLY